jgi:hypothetical protein
MKFEIVLKINFILTFMKITDSMKIDTLYENNKITLINNINRWFVREYNYSD